MNTSLEILCIGNELLIGKIQNTNATWIGKRATSIGIAVNRITIVGDDIHEISSTIKEILDRKPTFLITTGGLGPTFDDKTMQGIAIALDQQLEVNLEALGMVKRKYGEYAKTTGKKIMLTPPRIKMATLPETAEPLRNPVGTAPGVKLKHGQTILFVLPGVPSEMMQIFDESIEPELRKSSGGKIFLETSLRAIGIMESALAPLIDRVMHDYPHVYIKSHPRGEETKPHIELHFSTTSKQKKEATSNLKRASTELSKLIHENSGKASREASDDG